MSKGKNNKGKVAIGVAILLIGGVLAYFIFRKKPKPIEEEVIKKAYDNLLFAPNRATILKSSFASLDELAIYLQDKKIKIIGHTDNVGTDADNLELSEDRANAVKTYLINKSVPSESIEAIGMGETQPIADNNTSDGRAKNRRVELKINSHG